MSGTGAVLVLVEHEDGVPAAASLGALAVAAGLAQGLGAPLEAVALGEGAARLAGQLGALGVQAVRVAHDEPGDAGRPFETPALPGSILAGLLAASRPRALLAAGTLRGQEALAATAALAAVPFAAGCTELRPAGPDRLEVTRLRWAGSVQEAAALAGPTVCASIAEGTPSPPAPAASTAAPAAIDVLAGNAAAADPRVRLVERVSPQGGGVALGTARVVVGGGRGVGGPERFGPIEELASLLGAAVGVSRVVTSAGWRPHVEQVGQTGTRISPDLYVACGISGAIQHIVGCRGARAILAINTDPEAPIMARATHAVIGDLHEVVPAISAELRRRGARPA